MDEYANSENSLLSTFKPIEIPIRNDVYDMAAGHEFSIFITKD